MDRDDKVLTHFKSRSGNVPCIWQNTQNNCDIYELDWDRPSMQIDDVRFRYLGTSPLQSAYVGSCLRKLEHKCASSVYGI